MVEYCTDTKSIPTMLILEADCVGSSSFSNDELRISSLDEDIIRTKVRE